MTSILQKLRTITLANLHTLLDAVGNLNTIGEFEQYVRDLQTARDQLDDQSAASRARVKMLTQQIATAQANCAAANQQIDILLGDDDPENDRLAVPLQVQLDAATKQIATAQQQMEATQAEVSQYDQAVQRLDIRLTEAQGKLESLRLMEQGAKANEKAAKALSGIDFGSGPDTSGAEAKMTERAAVAANQLDRSLNRVAGAVGGVTSAEAAAAAAISERKRRLAEQKAQQTEAVS